MGQLRFEISGSEEHRTEHVKGARGSNKGTGRQQGGSDKGATKQKQRATKEHRATRGSSEGTRGRERMGGWREVEGVGGCRFCKGLDVCTLLCTEE